MRRVQRWPGAAVVGLVVAALALVSGDPGATAASDAGKAVVTRVTQKQKARKKARGKRVTPKAEAPAEGSEAAAAAPADGTLKFSRDIAPIIVTNCAGCHNPPRQARIKLDMSTFEKLMAGSPKGPVIVPGKPDESHLVLRIKGEETPRMPQGANRSLSADAIARVEQWVKAGAVIDAGINPKDPLTKYAASADALHKAELTRLSPEQRDKRVEDAGRARWKKASPNSTPEVATSPHFLLFGTLPKERAQVAVRAVENQYATVKALLGPGAVDWGEKASLFVFNDAASFGEFVRAVESRDVEATETATARFSGPEPYVAVVDPLAGRDEPAGSAARRPARGRRGPSAAGELTTGGPERSLAGLLTEQFAAGAAAATGKPPRWLTLGLGALVASRLEGRSPYVARLHRDAHQLGQLGWKSKAQDALGDASKAEDARAVGFVALEWIARQNRALLPPFVAGLSAGGEKLDDVLGQVLNLTREQFLEGAGLYVASLGGR
jgi:hypothetical protein